MLLDVKGKTFSSLVLEERVSEMLCTHFSYYMGKIRLHLKENTYREKKKQVADLDFMTFKSSDSLIPEDRAIPAPSLFMRAKKIYCITSYFGKNFNTK